MVIRFPSKLHMRLKVLAATQKRSMTALVVEAVEAAVEIQEDEATGGIAAEVETAFEAVARD